MYIISNNVKEDIAALLLNTYQEMLKYNINKKFMNFIFLNQIFLFLMNKYLLLVMISKPDYYS